MNTKNVPGLSTTTRQSFPILKTSHAAAVDSHSKENRDKRGARQERRAALASTDDRRRIGSALCHERTSRNVRAAAGVPARICVDSVAEAH
jgi:hypothetical protein